MGEPAVLEKVLYTASATSTGGREGRSKSDDGILDLALVPPKSLGGSGGPGTNPSSSSRPATPRASRARLGTWRGSSGSTQAPSSSRPRSRLARSARLRARCRFTGDDGGVSAAARSAGRDVPPVSRAHGPLGGGLERVFWIGERLHLDSATLTPLLKRLEGARDSLECGAAPRTRGSSRSS